MKTIEKTLEYYELLMTYEDTSKYIEYDLPIGYHIEFYKPGDEEAWVNIHMKSGEFTSKEKGLKHFHDFFDSFIDELDKRCFFIVTESGEKIATATISKLIEKEDGYDAAVDWVAITKEYQGKKLAKPMISFFIKLAHELGHNRLMLHTQTTTWLAAKLYLDLGFIPYNINENLKGWQILKTITNHELLEEIECIDKEEMYSKLALDIVKKLDEIYDDYEYEIWDKNNRNDVYVNSNNILYKYKFYVKDNDIELIENKE